MKNGEKLYNIAFNTVVDLFDIPGITNTTELDHIGKTLFGDKFNGTVPLDHLDKEKDGYWIVNTDTSDKGGEHWFGVVIDPEYKKPLVYDSFGRKLLHQLPHTENDPEQKEEEENCGARTIAWLLTYDLGGRSLAIQV